MAEITQHLGFDASDAITNLSTLTGKMNEANEALRNFKGAAKGTQQLKKTDKQLEKTKKKTSEFTISWETMVRVVQTQIIVRGLNAIIQGLKEATERARELGLAVAEVQTISGRMQTSEALTQDILDLSDRMLQEPTDLAEGYYQTLSNQVVEAGEAFNFMEDAAKLAVVTTSETGDAINALSSVMNSYNMGAEQAEHVSDTLFTTVEQGRVRLSEIANTLGRVTPLTAQMGVSWEETAAAIATMSKQGVSARKSITQLVAIMSKMIKPTDELRDIFHKWGVQDGKQAIETFGGLQGVLKKLSAETGGSSEEMANLLRRVRAITGEMGLMQGEGETLNEILDSMGDATSRVNKEWDRFQEEAAFKQTLASQELENTMTRLGTKLLPMVTFSLGVINRLLEDQEKFWDFVINGVNESTITVEVFENAGKKALDTIETRTKGFAEYQRNFYGDLTEAANKYYAELGKEEIKLQNIRDDGIKSAVNIFNKTAGDILSTYKNNISELENYIKEASGRVKSNAEEIASIQEQINDTVLQRRLSNAEGFYSKLQILESEYSQARGKALQAYRDIDATKESKEKTLSEINATLELNKQLQALAKQEGKQALLKKYQDDELDLQKSKIQSIEKNTKATKKAIDPVKKELEQRKEQLKTLEQLLERLKEIRKQGILSEEATKRMKEYSGEIKEILGDVDNGKKFLKSLNLGGISDSLVGNLDEAFEKAELDWSHAVESLKAAFEQEIIPIKVAIDPTGSRKQLRDTLGIERKPGEAPTQLARRTNEELITQVKELDAEERAVNDTLDIRNSFLQGAEKSLTNIQASLREEVERRAEAHMRSYKFATAGLSVAEFEAKKQEKIKSLMQERKGLANTLLNDLTAANEKVRQGKQLSEDELRVFRERITAARNFDQISRVRAEALGIVVSKLREASDEQKNINKLEKEMPSKEKQQILRDEVEALNAKRDALKEGADMSKQAADNLERAQQEMINLTEGANNSTTALSNTNNQARATANSAVQIGTKALSSVSGVRALIPAWNAVAEAARAAARAASQAQPAGPAQHHGGPMRYYNSGGLARGQDKVAAMLSKDEMVVNSKSSRRFFSELNAMNQGSQPVYREQGGPVTNVGDVNVTVNGGESSQQTVREIGHALRREIQRGNIKLS